MNINELTKEQKYEIETLNIYMNGNKEDHERLKRKVIEKKVPGDIKLEIDILIFKVNKLSAENIQLYEQMYKYKNCIQKIVTPDIKSLRDVYDLLHEAMDGESIHGRKISEIKDFLFNECKLTDGVK